MNKNLKTILEVIILMMLILILIVILLFNTTSGLNLILKMLPIKMETSSGNVATRFYLQHLKFENKDMIVLVEKLYVDWNPFDVFKHRLTLNKVLADGIQVQIKTAVNRNQTVAQKSWVNRVILKSAQLNNITIFVKDVLASNIKSISTFQTSSGTNKIWIALPTSNMTGYFKADRIDELPKEIALSSNSADLNDVWPSLPKAVKLDLLLLTSPKTIFIQKALIQVKNNLLKVQGSIGDKWNIQWNLTLPDFNEIDKNWHGDLYTRGFILKTDAKPHASFMLEGHHIQFKNYSIEKIFAQGKTWANQPNAIQWRLTANKIKLENYSIPTLYVQARNIWEEPKVKLLAKMSLTPKNLLQANLIFDLNKNMSGALAFKFLDLNNFVKTPALKNFRGVLTGKINLSGSLTQPYYAGKLRLENASGFVPQLGIHLKNSDINASITPSAFALQGKVFSGPGYVDLTSQIDLKRTFVKSMHITGSNFLIYNTPEYVVNASPNLQISWENYLTNVTGSLLLPRVRVKLKSYANVINLPPEMEFTHQKNKIPIFKNLALRFQLIFGSDVMIAYKQLLARLGGSIMVFQVPGGLPSGNGTIEMPYGTYKIYDKVFSFKDGRLIYVGNLLNDPALSINALVNQAVQNKNILGFNMNATHLKIGVAINGTLNAPRVTLISDPPMNQDDIMSYMVFGQPRANISNANALALLGTLATENNMPGPSQGDQPNMLGGLFGFLKSTLMSSGNTFNIDFPISKHFQLQTETSVSGTGANFQYIYED